LFSSLIVGVVYNIASAKLFGFEDFKNGGGSRLTLCAGIEPDRALLFNLAFLGRPLIIGLEKK
jgi:hypothetical protein